MNVAYIDTSCLVAIAFGEPSAAKIARRLDGFDELASSNLLDAELRAALKRENVPYDESLVAGLSWFLPDDPLGDRMEEALAAGYLRGADLWHIACALALVDDPADVTFLTLDTNQAKVAKKLGFRS